MSNDEITLRDLCARIPGRTPPPPSSPRDASSTRLTKPPARSLGALEPRLIIRAWYIPVIKQSTGAAAPAPSAGMSCWWTAPQRLHGVSVLNS